MYPPRGAYFGLFMSLVFPPNLGWSDFPFAMDWGFLFSRLGCVCAGLEMPWILDGGKGGFFLSCQPVSIFPSYKGPRQLSSGAASLGRQ